MLQKICISNKCGTFECAIHQKILKKTLIMVSTKILSSTTVLNIDNTKNVSKALNQQIRRISEGSYDIDNWEY